MPGGSIRPSKLSSIRGSQCQTSDRRGVGPFDNDTAADFANALDDAEPEAREALIRGVLIRRIDATGYEADHLGKSESLVLGQPLSEQIEPVVQQLK
ncbi:DUF4259 domain-containing protein [Streptomyces sp. NPDC058274]|uniref:DUF4259 domain-containing protein n=1 Tax=Streptomyces sp. NPDC058274 TaxID=3346416 RepID=UPI0036E53BA5